MKAFPSSKLVEQVTRIDNLEGMDLRDYFAKDFAIKLIGEYRMTHDEEFRSSVCKQSYVWADAMMKARNQDE